MWTLEKCLVTAGRSPGRQALLAMLLMSALPVISLASDAVLRSERYRQPEGDLGRDSGYFLKAGSPGKSSENSRKSSASGNPAGKVSRNVARGGGEYDPERFPFQYVGQVSESGGTVKVLLSLANAFFVVEAGSLFHERFEALVLEPTYMVVRDVKSQEEFRIKYEDLARAAPSPAALSSPGQAVPPTQMPRERLDTSPRRISHPMEALEQNPSNGAGPGDAGAKVPDATETPSRKPVSVENPLALAMPRENGNGAGASPDAPQQVLLWGMPISAPKGEVETSPAPPGNPMVQLPAPEELPMPVAPPNPESSFPISGKRSGAGSN